MTTLEQEAREKAQDALAAKKGMDWTENAWLYGEGYEHGFLAAAEPREQEIEALMAKVAEGMCEYQDATHDFYEMKRKAELAEAKVRELEEMVKFRDEFMRERYRQAFTDCFPPIPLPGEER